MDCSTSACGHGPESPSVLCTIPGKPRQFTIHLDGVGYYKSLADIAARGYPGFVFEGKPAPVGGIKIVRGP